jgi:hypothetical protein
MARAGDSRNARHDLRFAVEEGDAIFQQLKIGAGNLDHRGMHLQRSKALVRKPEIPLIPPYIILGIGKTELTLDVEISTDVIGVRMGDNDLSRVGFFRDKYLQTGTEVDSIINFRLITAG